MASSAASHQSKFESSLLPAAALRGRPIPHWTVSERLAHYRVPALSLAVFDGGEIVWAQAYGLTAAGTGQPVTPETRFQAGSISKPVAALAALRLVDQGRLDLDADVNRYLTSWQVPENDFTRQRPVTLRRLLSHSAGLTVHGFWGYAAGLPLPSLRQILDGQPPANTDPIRVDQLPGSEWRYSGGGFAVLQQLLTDVSGQDFATLVRALLFEPLEMDHSGYALPEDLARGHDLDGQPVPGGWHTQPELAAAGLWSTPSDLARFALGIQRAFAGAPGPLLSPALAQAMLSPQMPDFGLGLALIQDDPPRFAHGGDTVGYKCQLVAYTSGGRGAVLMTNGDYGDPLIFEALRGLAAVHGWPGYPIAEKSVAPANPAAWAAYAGTYALDSDPAIRLIVEPQSDSLRYTVHQGPTTRVTALWPSSDTHFFRLDTELEYTFQPDPDGLCRHLLVHRPDSTTRATRVA